MRPPRLIRAFGDQTHGRHARDNSVAQPIVPTPAASGAAAVTGPADGARWQAAGRRSWATLLRRVFAIQVLVCERCGGPRRILGALTEPHAVRRVLVALGLAAKPPPARPGPAA